MWVPGTLSTMFLSGAQLIYSGPLGPESSALIAYLEAVPGVHPISAGENPATWMLEVTGGASITGKSKAASVDFAEYYKVRACLGCMHAGNASIDDPWVPVSPLLCHH